MALFVLFQATVFEDIGGGARGNRPVEHGYKADTCAEEADWPMCTDNDWVGMQLDKHYSYTSLYTSTLQRLALGLLLCHDKYRYGHSYLLDSLL